MEVVAATPNGNGVSPFHNHDVREWSRIDSLTGILERARLETDHWTASTSNTSHKYGKVVDSRARSGADGSLQQQARRQLEVFQSQIPGGRLQVIKTQTVSSSRWTNKSSSSLETKDSSKDFENLQLSLNHLDLTSEKSKASVGRSVVRRPPSRPRAREEKLLNGNENITKNLQNTATTNLYRVSRLCHQIHENAVKQTFGKYYKKPNDDEEQRQNGDGSETVHEIEIENGHTNLTRTKSTSSEDLLHLSSPEKDKTKSIEDLEDLEQLQNWRRTSKIRRSLQFPKQNKNTSSTRPPDLPQNTGSVRKIREDLETGRRLNTALRGNNVDLEALDQILQSISSSSSIYSDQNELPDKEVKQKRNSFVTVETLKEVKGRLRRTSFPSSDEFKMKKDEEIDDGIVTEDQNINEISTSPSRVKSYIYGMESINGTSLSSGTGSLESRSKYINNNLINRNEDWYNRRKSYGFEQVQTNQEQSISSKRKNKVESSTDSGICRSSEIALTKLNDFDFLSNKNKIDTVINPGSVRKFSTLFEQNNNKEITKNTLNWKTNGDLESTTIRIPIGQNNNLEYTNNNKNNQKIFTNDGTKFSNTTAWIKPEENKRHSIAVDEYKYVNNNNINQDNKYRRTSLAINDTFSPEDYEENSNNKKTKKVEFCKTEVHFAAESGRVNIVETDEKPPPTQNFRRRRRNSGLINTENFPITNQLPILHFGDTSYEKNLYVTNATDDPNDEDLIYENLKPKKELVSCSTVTINTNSLKNHMEDIKDNDNDMIKGILKNKPIKPKPYILGESKDVFNNNDNEEINENSVWGVKLKPIQKDDKPIWRSTVTVRNTFFDPANNNDNDNNVNNEERKQQQPNQQPEFQKLLKCLRPTNKKNDNLLFDNGSINIVTPPLDTRRSSWSVADRVKQVEDLQWTENKGYSTKVTIGEGDAIVVENLPEKERHPTWPRNDESFKDLKKQVLKKGLVVRIGRDDSNSKHTVCSKTTTNRDNANTTTTTTKITIDLTPSPTNDNINNDINKETQNLRLSSNEISSHSFKSTSLILNTINNKNEKIPQQLEALRKLYEDVHSDSEADKEVQSLMSKNEEIIQLNDDNDNTSVVSGSWSKMRSFKNINQYFHKSHNNCNNSALHAHLDKGTNIENLQQKTTIASQKERIYSKNIVRSKSSPVREKYSPSLIRRQNNNYNELSSPSLVGQNIITTKKIEKDKNEAKEIILKNTNKEQQIKIQKSEVLRVPKKSEMAYFGISVSPKPQQIKQIDNKLTEQPDLLKFSKKQEKEPTYENVETIKKEINSYKKNDFDSSILDELTKAADQIMQAVNGYVDDDRLKSGTDDDKYYKQEPLDTISETKSWKRDSNTQKQLTTYNNNNNRSKLKSTSSNSSIDSFTRECRKSSSTPIKKNEKLYEKQQRKKSTLNDTSTTTATTTTTTATSTTVKALTRARRLQRASSREALLQSHGSSSEDLPTNDVPLRKPRLIKRTKTTQLTMSNGIEMQKKPEKNSNTTNKKLDDVQTKKEERYQGLREIRHKTAVSTIRSTAEKAASREQRSKLKAEELKKKTTSKKDINKGTSVTSRNRIVSSPRETTISHRVSSAITKKPTTSKVSTRS